MMADIVYELFVFKNSAVTRELRQVLRDTRLAQSKSEIEAVADSLVDSYLSQIKFATLFNAKKMSEYYEVFYSLENEIRDFIEDTMVGAHGTDWWDQHAPQVVRDNVQRNRDREAGEGIPPRSDREIDYTTFGELSEIIKDNWDIFSGLFSNASKGRVLRVLNRLNIYRGPIAHCNFLPEEEALRLKLAVRDWFKLME